jgi:hypothetical protein
MKHAVRFGLATLDLSAASDTISALLVQQVLSPEWFELLDIARSPFVTMPDGTVHELEKFSSMGNGYTFELESLLFLCIARSITPRSLHSYISVYGDDIIIPQEYSEAMIERLNTLGFSVNSDKSFWHGPFRESCGSFTYNGTEVAPFYLGSDGNIPFALQVANRLKVWLQRIPTDKLHACWQGFAAQVPALWDHPVPLKLGDAGLIVTEAEAREHAKRPYRSKRMIKRQLDGVLIRYMMLRPRRRALYHYGTLLYSLHNAGPARGYVSRGLIPEIQVDDNEDYTRGIYPILGLFMRPVTRVTPVLWSDFDVIQY